jgi:hypothetical protein
MGLSVPITRMVDASVLSSCYPVEVTRLASSWGVTRCTPRPRTSPPSTWVRNDINGDDIQDPHQRYVFSHVYLLFVMFNEKMDFRSPIKSKLSKNQHKLVFEYAPSVAETIVVPHLPPMHGLTTTFTLSGAKPVLRLSVDLRGPPNVRKTIFE